MSKFGAFVPFSVNDDTFRETAAALESDDITGSDKINWAEVIFVPDQGIILEFIFRFYLEVTKNIFIPNLST